METAGRDIALDAGGKPRSFSDWFDQCAREGGFTDSQLAKAYAKLFFLKPKEHRNEHETTPPQTHITNWRTGKGKPPGAAVAYRIGRSLQELGLPVSGLEALIAGHHLVVLLGTVGTHISRCIARSKPAFYSEVSEIEHISMMLDRLAPRIARELTIRKMQLGIGGLDVEEVDALNVPLPEDELYPKEQTPRMDEAFLDWTYRETDAFQKLPPSIAAAIELLKNPTSEVVELASTHLENPYTDISSLFFTPGTPRWVLRACGADDHPQEHVEPDSEPDFTALNAFFAEFYETFNLPGTWRGCWRSATYPNVDVKLYESEDHPTATGIDVFLVVVDAAHRDQQLDIAVIEYLKHLGEKHGLTLVTCPADDADSQRYRDCDFKVCRDRRDRLEWPRCAHEKGTKAK